LNEHPVVLDKPIVPSFSKNAKGYVLFKAQQSAKPNIISEADGIYLRNDGSNHRVIPKDKPKPEQHQQADDLDDLLSLKQQKSAEAASFPILPQAPKKTMLPKPGSIKKPIVKKDESVVDDEAWLDDLLG
jgi:hypothetical protein